MRRASPSPNESTPLLSRITIEITAAPEEEAAPSINDIIDELPYDLATAFPIVEAILYQGFPRDRFAVILELHEKLEQLAEIELKAQGNALEVVRVKQNAVRAELEVVRLEPTIPNHYANLVEIIKSHGFTEREFLTYLQDIKDSDPLCLFRKNSFTLPNLNLYSGGDATELSEMLKIKVVEYVIIQLKKHNISLGSQRIRNYMRDVLLSDYPVMGTSLFLIFGGVLLASSAFLWKFYAEHATEQAVNELITWFNNPDNVGLYAPSFNPGPIMCWWNVYGVNSENDSPWPSTCQKHGFQNGSFIVRGDCGEAEFSLYSYACSKQYLDPDFFGLLLGCSIVIAPNALLFFLALIRSSFLGGFNYFVQFNLCVSIIFAVPTLLFGFLYDSMGAAFHICNNTTMQLCEDGMRYVEEEFMNPDTGANNKTFISGHAFSNKGYGDTSTVHLELILFFIILLSTISSLAIHIGIMLIAMLRIDVTTLERLYLKPAYLEEYATSMRRLIEGKLMLLGQRQQEDAEDADSWELLSPSSS